MKFSKFIRTKKGMYVCLSSFCVWAAVYASGVYWYFQTMPKIPVPENARPVNFMDGTKADWSKILGASPTSNEVAVEPPSSLVGKIQVVGVMASTSPQAGFAMISVNAGYPKIFSLHAPILDDFTLKEITPYYIVVTNGQKDEKIQLLKPSDVVKKKSNETPPKMPANVPMSMPRQAQPEVDYSAPHPDSVPSEGENQ